MKDHMKAALEKAAIEWDKESPDDQFAIEIFDDGFKRGWKAALSAVPAELSSNPLQLPAQEPVSSNELLKPVAWGYAWQCKSVGDWRIEKLGEGCIPPKDTLALYVIPPAPEGVE